jgi:signal transduction histidine kinase
MSGPGSAPAETQPGAPDDAVAHFAARVAHDFNNLLTGVLGNLELLQMRAARQNLPGLDAYLDGANSAGGRAVAFAARLMVYSGRGTSPPAPVALDAVLARFQDRAACRLGAGDAAVLCDAGQLELAVAELLANAAEAGGAAVITSFGGGDCVTITIRDNGCGMSPDVLAQARAPFFTTASNGTGRGLGLPIVARVVQDMAGQLEIEAEEGAGCTITLKLPRA